MKKHNIITILSFTALLSLPFAMNTNAQENQQNQSQQSEQKQYKKLADKLSTSLSDLIQALGNKIIVLAITENKPNGTPHIDAGKDNEMLIIEKDFGALLELENEQISDIAIIRLYMDDNPINQAYRANLHENMEGPTLSKDPSDHNNQREQMSKNNQQENQRNSTLTLTPPKKPESKVLIIDKEMKVHPTDLDQDSTIEEIKQEIKNAREQANQ